MNRKTVKQQVAEAIAAIKDDRNYDGPMKVAFVLGYVQDRIGKESADTLTRWAGEARR